MANPFVDPAAKVWIEGGPKLVELPPAPRKVEGVVGILTMTRPVLVVTCPFGNV